MTARQLRISFRDTVTAVLGKLDPDMRMVRANVWEFAIRNGGLTRVTASMSAEWLSLSAQLPHANGASGTALPEWLRYGRLLPGGVRIGIGRILDPWVLADIVLHEDVDPNARLREACEGLRAAIHLVSQGTPGLYREPRSSQEDWSANDGPVDFVALSDPETWTVSYGGSGRYTVPLETPRSFSQAVITQTSSGAARIAAELAPSSVLNDVSRAAIALFVARTNYSIRLLRGVLNETGNNTSIAFESRFDSSPCGAELAEALAGLSSTCMVTVSEIQALANGAIARAYLESLNAMSATIAAGCSS